MASVRFSSAEPSHRRRSSGTAVANRLEQSVARSLDAPWVPSSLHGLPDIVKCASCAGRGSRGWLVCRSHCHRCEGTGEASKLQLLELLRGMRLGDVDAAVVLHAASAAKRDDEDIVLLALGRFPKAIQFVSARLQASAKVTEALQAAEQALQKQISDRSHLSDRSRSGCSVSTACRPEELSEEAAEWGSFSQQNPDAALSTETAHSERTGSS